MSAAPTSRPDPSSLPAPSPTAVAARLYLVLMPVGHLVYLPVAGAMGTGADVALLLFLISWGMDLLFHPVLAQELARVIRGERVAWLPGRRVLLGFVLMAAFGAWVALSGQWGFHPRYAQAKGVGVGALAVGGLALATSRVGWRRAADAWLVGTGLALLVTLLGGGLGSEAFRARVFSGGSGILGLPFPRVSGPMLHPNMFGGYLVVSALLLWERWPEWQARARPLALALAAGVGTALFLTASTAWIGGGVAVALLGRGVGGAEPPRRGALLRLGGTAAAAAVLVALVVPLDFHLGWVHVVTNAIRPAIWGSSFAAVVARPIVGVGASPFVAEAADPLRGGAMGLWDAHNAYLSVMGQFGLVGFTLLAAGVSLVVAAVWRRPVGSRARSAVLLVLMAVAIHGLFLASEDLRHVWVVMGLAGVLAAEGAAEEAAHGAGGEAVEGTGEALQGGGG